MALNVPLISTLHDGIVPAGMVGEAFILRRDGVELELQSAPVARGTYRAAGRVFMTTARLCFVPFDAGAGGGVIHSVELPLAGIRDVDYKQPFFGANSLVGRILPLPGRGLDAAGGSGAPFRIVFKTGSAATLLHFLWRLMEQYANADAAARAAFVRASSAPAAAPAFVAAQTAFFDPADPSVVYLTQPAWAAPAPAPPAPAP